jgi:short-subunit dehydrogenase
MDVKRILMGGAVAGVSVAAATGLGALALAGMVLRGAGARLLQGKTVVITGGSRGLGMELAREFGAAGARLLLVARNGEELDRARETLIREGCVAADEVLVYMADVTDRGQVERMIAWATEQFGQVDVLVNNAGMIHVGPVEDQRVENFEESMKTNYFAMVYSCKAVMPQMLARRGGNIVNIASIGGKMAVPHLLPYSASKFAAVGFSEGLHAELRGKGIRVTTVCPGLMRTGSAPQALVVGDRTKEYEWFSLGAMLPGVAASARHAAKKIVRATVAGRAEITISPQAYLGARVAGISPGLMGMAMSAVNEHALPKATGADEPVKASDAPEPDSKLWRWARRWNEGGKNQRS